jgi:hypothetical protein
VISDSYESEFEVIRALRRREVRRVIDRLHYESDFGSPGGFRSPRTALADSPVVPPTPTATGD